MANNNDDDDTDKKSEERVNINDRELSGRPGSPKSKYLPIVDEYNTDIVDNKLLPMLMTMFLILTTLMAVLLILFEYY